MKGYFRKDLDSHNYFIPSEKINEFDQLIGRMGNYQEYSTRWEQLNDKFLELFDQYCLPGAIEVYLCEIDDGELE
jgi:hypothetical protein